MARAALLLLALITAAAAAAFFWRVDLAMWLTARAVTANMTTDAIAELPDGLHLAVCGAGSPMPDPDRSGPCLAVIAGSRLLLFDAGSGGARNLQRMGLPAGRLSAVFLTHYHSDHIDGLGETLMLRWTGGAHAEPLAVYGPPGVDAVVDGFNRAYRLDATYRTAHHGTDVAPPAGAGGRPETFIVPASGDRVTVWDVDGVRVSAFAVDHEPVSPSVGYRVDYGGRSLVISGDTVSTPSVREAARGVDLLAHEALSPRLVGILNDAARRAGLTGLAAITHDIVDYHTTPVEAAELAQQAGAGHLLLYHIVPPLPLPGLSTALLEGVSEAYDGPVTVARDGHLLSLPTGSTRIEVTRRL
jgi:ribonuclease Z